jgi:hypothetical protein
MVNCKTVISGLLNLPIGDMNCNGIIDTGDATLVLREVVGLDIPKCWE